MGLTGREKECLDKLDIRIGGGLSEFMTNCRKLEPVGSKFLFVGLGGKGCKTVAAIKKEVYQKVKCPEGKKRPENFEYLAIDSDGELLRHLCQKDFGETELSMEYVDMETCNLYDPQSAMYLASEKKHLLPEYITSWLNPAINGNCGEMAQAVSGRLGAICCLEGPALQGYNTLLRINWKNSISRLKMQQ